MINVPVKSIWKDALAVLMHLSAKFVIKVSFYLMIIVQHAQKAVLLAKMQLIAINAQDNLHGVQDPVIAVKIMLKDALFVTKLEDV